MQLPGKQGAGGSFNIPPHKQASVVKDGAQVSYDSTYFWDYSQGGRRVWKENWPRSVVGKEDGGLVLGQEWPLSPKG